MEQRFKKWMKENTELAEVSCDKYARAVRAVSKEMKSIGIITTELYSIHSSLKFHVMCMNILENEQFIDKNRRGNNMYSCALKHYSNYLQTEETADTGERPLGSVLKEMYENAPQGEMAVQLHLFGIKYAKTIKENNLSISNIIKFAGVAESYSAEIYKGIHLAKYVVLKSDLSEFLE